MRRKWFVALSLLLLLLTACGNYSKEPDSFTVTVYTGLPQEPGRASATTYEVENSFIVPELTRPGYDFIGLQYYQSIYPAGTRVSVSYDMAMTAVWEEKAPAAPVLDTRRQALEDTGDAAGEEPKWQLIDYEVTINDKASGTSQTYNLKPGTYAVPFYERPGYIFLGLSDGDALLSPGESLEVSSDLELTAEWLLLEYNVEIAELYDASGEPYTENVPLLAGSFKVPKYARSGYIFLGLSDGERIYRPGESIEVRDDISLTAVWKQVEYTLTLDGLYDSFGNRYSKTFSITPGDYEVPSLSRSGYIYLGLSDGTSLFLPGDTVTVSSSSLTLTAEWEIIEHTVTVEGLYDNNDEVTEEHVLVPGTYTVPAYFREGYIYLGLYDGEGMLTEGDILTVSEDMTLKAEWLLIEFTVTIEGLYDKNDHQVTESFDLVPGPYEVAGFTRKGYNFLGLSDGSVLYPAGSTVMVEEDITLKAEWELIEHTVTIDGLYNSSNRAVSETYTLLPGSFDVPVYSRDGYYFLGLANGDEIYETGDIITLSEDLNLTALWKLIEYTVTIEGLRDAADNAFSESYTMLPGTFTVPKYSRNGYYFLGLSDGENVYPAGGSIIVSKDLDLTAEWMLIEYTVSIEGIYDEDGQASSETYIMAPGPFEVPSYSRDGYYFLGLSDGAKTYPAESTVAISDDTTLSALWKLIEYTVTVENLYYNGAEISAEYIVIPGPFKIPEYSRSGYYFLGLSDGTGLYAPGESVMITSDTTLAASWKLIEHRVTVDNLYDDSTKTSEEYVVVPGPFEVPSYSRDGYYYLGLSDSTTLYPEGSSVDITGDKTLSALWKLIQHRVTINGIYDNGMETSDEYIAIPDSYPVPEYSRDGYYYLGLSDGTNLYAPGESVTINADTTLNAVWKLIELTVTINGIFDGDEETSEEYVVIPGTYSVPEYSRDGYYYLGLSDGVNIYAPRTRADVTEDITLTALWELIEYKVTINGLYDGDVETSEEYIVVPGTYTVPGFSRDGYYYLGLYDGAEIYAADESVTIAADTILNAVWKLIEFTVTINGLYDNEGETSEEYVVVPGSYAVPEYSRDGYYYLGLYDGINLYTAGESVVIDADTTLNAVWKLIEYTITINGLYDNEGETSEEYVVVPGSYAVPEYSRDGYYYLGLTDGINLYTAGESVVINADTTLNAVWKLIEYTVTINGLYDGDVETSEEYVVVPDSYAVPEYSRDGYYYLGLTDGINLYTAGESVVIDADTTLNAVWKLIEYTITINGLYDGADETSEEFIVVPGSYPVPEYSRDGYYYLGLTDDINLYTAGESVVIDSDTTLNALWKLIEFTVTINGIFDGGAETSEEYVVVPGSYAVPEYSRDGYYYLGLYDGINLYTAGDSVVINADTTLNAVWKLIEFTVTINGIFDGDEETSEEYVVVPDSYAVPEYSRDGYYFLGLSGGPVLYSTGDSVVINADTTLNAVWKLIEYTVTINGLYDGSDETSEEYVVVPGTYAVPEYSRDGYYYLGLSDGAVLYAAGESVTIAADTTLDAAWKLIEFTVTINGIFDGDEETSEEYVVLPGTYAVPEYSRDGYYYLGLSDGSTLYAEGDTVNVTEDIALTALWELIEYTVTINGLYDGDVETSEEYVVVPGSYVVPEFFRDGYYFLGLSDGINLYTAGDSVVINADTTLNALWKLIEYTVTINGIFDGDEETSEEYVVLPGTYAVPEYSRDGYYFLGLSDGDDLFAAGESVSVGSDLRLSASWKLIEFTVTINGLYDEDAEISEEYIVVPGSYPVPEYSRDGYYYLGLSDGINLYTAGDSVVINADTTLNAVWKLIEYTITINGIFDGDEETSEEYVVVPGSYAVPEFFRDGYYFLGLSDGSALYPAGESVTIAEDSTFTALWELIEYSISINGIYDGSEEKAEEYVVLPGTYAVPEYSRDGYYFLGLSDGDSLYTAGESVSVESDMRLSASWKLIEFTVTVEDLSDDGTEEYVVVPGLYAVPEFTRPGRIYLGLGDGDTLYRAGDIVNVTEDMTLSALWELIDYTVTVSGLYKGDEETEEEYVVNIGSYAVPEYSRDGYYFLGLSDGDSLYAAGESVMIEESSAFTALWELIEYTVTINGIFDGDAETSEEYVVVPGSYAVPEYSRDGYYYLGLSDGASLYKKGESVDVNADMALSASWELIEYKVTIKGMYDEAGNRISVTYRMTPGIFTVPEYINEGHEFLGLSDESEFYPIGEGIEVNEDLSFIAEWV